MAHIHTEQLATVASWLLVNKQGLAPPPLAASNFWLRSQVGATRRAGVPTPRPLQISPSVSGRRKPRRAGVPTPPPADPLGPTSAHPRRVAAHCPNPV